MDREIYDNYDIYHWYLSPLRKHYKSIAEMSTT